MEEKVTELGEVQSYVHIEDGSTRSRNTDEYEYHCKHRVGRSLE